MLQHNSTLHLEDLPQENSSYSNSGVQTYLNSCSKKTSAYCCEPKISLFELIYMSVRVSAYKIGFGSQTLAVGIGFVFESMSVGENVNFVQRANKFDMFITAQTSGCSGRK